MLAADTPKLSVQLFRNCGLVQRLCPRSWYRRGLHPVSVQGSLTILRSSSAQHESRPLSPSHRTRRTKNSFDRLFNACFVLPPTCRILYLSLAHPSARPPSPAQCLRLRSCALQSSRSVLSAGLRQPSTLPTLQSIIAPALTGHLCCLESHDPSQVRSALGDRRAGFDLVVPACQKRYNCALTPSIRPTFVTLSQSTLCRCLGCLQGSVDAAYRVGSVSPEHHPYARGSLFALHRAGPTVSPLMAQATPVSFAAVAPTSPQRACNPLRYHALMPFRVCSTCAKVVQLHMRAQRCGEVCVLSCRHRCPDCGGTSAECECHHKFKIKLFKTKNIVGKIDIRSEMRSKIAKRNEHKQISAIWLWHDMVKTSVQPRCTMKHHQIT